MEERAALRRGRGASRETGNSPIIAYRPGFTRTVLRESTGNRVWNAGRFHAIMANGIDIAQILNLPIRCVPRRVFGAILIPGNLVRRPQRGCENHPIGLHGCGCSHHRSRWRWNGDEPALCRSQQPSQRPYCGHGTRRGFGLDRKWSDLACAPGVSEGKTTCARQHLTCFGVACRYDARCQAKA